MKTIISQLLNKNSPEILNDELFQLRHDHKPIHLLRQSLAGHKKTRNKNSHGVLYCVRVCVQSFRLNLVITVLPSYNNWPEIRLIFLQRKERKLASIK